MRLTPALLTATVLCAACEGRAPEPVAAPPPAPTEIVREPVWTRRPTPQEIAALRPKEAADVKLSAVANLWCTARADGTLTACQLDWQDPPGKGFGDAALKASPLFRIAPTDRLGSVDGRPVEVQLTWPKPGERP